MKILKENSVKYSKKLNEANSISADKSVYDVIDELYESLCDYLNNRFKGSAYRFSVFYGGRSNSCIIIERNGIQLVPVITLNEEVTAFYFGVWDDKGHLICSASTFSELSNQLEDKLDSMVEE